MGPQWFITCTCFFMLGYLNVLLAFGNVFHTELIVIAKNRLSKSLFFAWLLKKKNQTVLDQYQVDIFRII